MKQAVTSWLQKLDTSFFFANYKSCHGETNVWIAMVTKLKSDVYCVLHLYPIYTEVKIMFLASEHLLPYFETSLCIQPIWQYSWLLHSTCYMEQRLLCKLLCIMIFIAGFCIQETCWEGCSIFTEVEGAWENNCVTYSMASILGTTVEKNLCIIKLKKETHSK